MTSLFQDFGWARLKKVEDKMSEGCYLNKNQSKGLAKLATACFIGAGLFIASNITPSLQDFYLDKIGLGIAGLAATVPYLKRRN